MTTTTAAPGGPTGDQDGQPAPAITPELITQRCGIKPPRAEELAAYAHLRAQGLDRYAAAAELGRTNQTADRWERWLTSFRRELGLPPLPAPPRPRRLDLWPYQ